LKNPYRDRPQGAFYSAGSETAFRVWAPRRERVELLLEDACVAMQCDEDGFFEARAAAPPGARYAYRVDGETVPDPASRHQPDGVHGRSAVVDPSFAWTDSGWKGVARRDVVLYELHVATFTPEGTFDGAISRLGALRELGITMIEIMPIAQFPGDRNWGYDGVLPYAAQNTYGGPDGLRRLVDAAHREGIGVCIDVVYNHLGPEGNRLDLFGPYFTDRYKTPWGLAINYDGADSDPVREYFIGNALMWVEQCHVDALRLDAVHAIFDTSAYPFLEELGDRAHEKARELGREVLVIAESDLNDPRLVRSSDQGGFGLDAHWNDDFHHALHALLTGEDEGYYKDFGRVGHLAAVFEKSYAYAGHYSAHRRRRHGKGAHDIEPSRLVVATQNHDQVGNRMKGERLSALVGFEALKLAAGSVLLSPFLPLLFMGEEYGEPAPFLYFVSHSDSDLIEAVRQGRKSEFSAFAWQGDPPDPQSEETFARSRLDRRALETVRHSRLLALHGELLRLRRAILALGVGSMGTTRATAYEAEGCLLVRRTEGSSSALLAMNFSPQARTIDAGPFEGTWQLVVDTTDTAWLGPGGTAPPLLQASAAVAISLGPHSLAAWVEGSAGR
jgi:maltooligosyltrehalose trehalohydrolase